jgi:hypothetical protein
MKTPDLLLLLLLVNAGHLPPAVLEHSGWQLCQQRHFGPGQLRT